MFSFFFFFNDTATTEIYTLSLHDALPISPLCQRGAGCFSRQGGGPFPGRIRTRTDPQPLRGMQPLRQAPRSEEHTSELQSQSNLVCRLLLEKKKKMNKNNSTHKTR